MHLDAYLEPCAGFGWQGGPKFNTSIDVLQNGDEYRNADWIEARHSFTAPYKNIRPEAFRAIKKMFLVCRGMLHAFRFRDELDYQASNETFAIGDGVEDTFQLAKLSLADGVEYLRYVYALVGVPTITINGTPTTAFDYNPRTGQVRFDSPPAPGDVLAWSGEFDIWVRFATDDLVFSLDDPRATNGTVSVIEVPPPDEVVASP